jgi:diguanylate cyclase (GGDEF)-like protein
MPTTTTKTDIIRTILDNTTQFRGVLDVTGHFIELNQLALYDALTGLATRPFLMERLNQAIAHSKRDGLGQFAVLFIDLDNFKQVNDRLGHSAGDALLVAVAKKLKASFRETDTVARLGGDEFVVLLNHPISQKDSSGFAERILRELRFELATPDGPITVTGSIGIASYDPRFSSAEELLGQADKAMYRAKALGKEQATLW